MTNDGWKTPAQIATGASGFFSFRLLVMLVDKKILTQTEAASLMTATANDIRSGTEGGEGEQAGEALATSYERMAAWLLGQDPGL